jgi:transcriptional regulator with XRE-family HTH domain
LGLSLVGFAKAIDFKAPSAVSYWEQGKGFPSAEALIAMHELFDKPMPWLLGESTSSGEEDGRLRRVIRQELERDARFTPAIVRRLLDRSDLLEDLVELYKADAAWEWHAIAGSVRTSMRRAARDVLFKSPPGFIFGQPAAQDLAPARVSVGFKAVALPHANSVLRFVEMQNGLIRGEVGPFALTTFLPTPHQIALVQEKARQKVQHKVPRRNKR